MSRERETIDTKSDGEAARKAELAECEANIALGRKAYYKMGCSFRTIEDNELHIIAGYNDFYEYTLAVHHLRESSVYRYMQIANIYDRLVPLVGEKNMPYHASTLGAMTGLKSEQEIQVYRLALTKTTDGALVVTADIKAARKELGLIKVKKSKDSSQKQTGSAEDAPPAALPNMNGTEGKQSEDAPDTAPAAEKGVAVDQDDAASKQAAAKEGKASDKGNAGKPQAKSGKSPNTGSGHFPKSWKTTRLPLPSHGKNMLISCMRRPRP